jgi:methyltransferase (TIGR00027 family)
MKTEQRSRTADAAAATRARHHRYAAPRVFEDPFALALTSPGWRRIVESRVLTALVYRVLFARMRGGDTQVIGRSRWAEDQLENALARGVSQYVIVGAGLDSFALRRPDLADALVVFELDHPATQSAKVRRLEELGLATPANLERVAVDFEREAIADALSRSRFSPSEPAFFSWLGTTYYLRNESVLRTLESLGEFAVGGSEIVFDYRVPPAWLSPEQARRMQRAARFTARRGEPMIGQFAPDDLAEALDRLDYDRVGDLSGEDLYTRYFAAHPDAPPPPPSSRFLHARLRADHRTEPA